MRAIYFDRRVYVYGFQDYYNGFVICTAFVLDNDDTAPNIFGEEKKRITAAAARFVSNGITLSLDTGSMVSEI